MNQSCVAVVCHQRSVVHTDTCWFSAQQNETCAQIQGPGLWRKVFTFEGTSLLQTCSVQQEEETTVKTEDQGFCLKMPYWFILNLETKIFEWWLVGLGVENTVLCHNWLKGCPQPLCTCFPGDMGLHLLCLMSKRWCVQHRCARTFVVLVCSQSQ